MATVSTVPVVSRSLLLLGIVIVGLAVAKLMCVCSPRLMLQALAGKFVRGRFKETYRKLLLEPPPTDLCRIQFRHLVPSSKCSTFHPKPAGAQRAFGSGGVEHVKRCNNGKRYASSWGCSIVSLAYPNKCLSGPLPSPLVFCTHSLRIRGNEFGQIWAPFSPATCQ